MEFKISENDFFEDNPQAGLIPIFKEVGSKGMKYIALVYSYDTILKRLPLEKKKSKAIKMAGYEPTPKGRPSKEERDLVELRGIIPNAIEAFTELQFDEDKEIMQAYEHKIQEDIAIVKKPNKTIAELKYAASILTKDLKEIKAAKEEMARQLKIRNESFKELETQEGTSDIAIEQYLEQENDD
jgi:hypothetical protein